MHPNEALARREIELIQAGDFEALEDIYASDLVIHYPGRNPLSGTHHVNEFLSRFEALLGDGTLTRELHDALGSDDHAVQLLRVTRLGTRTLPFVERGRRAPRARREILRVLAPRRRPVRLGRVPELARRTAYPGRLASCRDRARWDSNRASVERCCLEADATVWAHRPVPLGETDVRRGARPSIRRPAGIPAAPRRRWRCSGPARRRRCPAGEPRSRAQRCPCAA